MEEIVFETKDALDWSYRSEGVVNLVLAYSGSSPTFVHFIDLDMRPLERMEAYYESDKKIMKTYLEMLKKKGDRST
ncbi:Inositol-pentakisphosphate 2-kinase family protein [Arabidopsis thaliana]|uniref:Inositol-pentakisphosphate 2-kinase family protein n=1 Tax=Arabidopsis thaliana TaxID=3702 RepID=Q94HW4_ARATH|nr:Inositol-pentakisphosphate 2-kinase family protein [Arabidopsis thaliana]NP_176152.1 Inositol-pentakisphosphate 2-kinase family protein [Arabidopsis thaliana]AAK62781.1 hypothetical protein [Arabidopsis thaliana]AEE33571.1 Inositol-pentakisphosphate 2-kinase family protein [Arabidopsis thaliana]AEE33572.2 Inositol-pentakisphosphate 2-kinase family protein [Arabidopsis thaliana]|eukprot:NP_001319270.1 Inositol-pentakisphosphate 2-kinase family protein [Arabidopsis thaliana]